MEQGVKFAKQNCLIYKGKVLIQKWSVYLQMWKRQNLYGSWSANVANKAKARSFYSREMNRRQMCLSSTDGLHYLQVNSPRSLSKDVSIRRNVQIPRTTTTISGNNRNNSKHLYET